MKKLAFLVLIVLVAVSVMPVSASAFLDKRDVVVDGKPLLVSAKVKNNVTFVPFRELFEEFGLSINYDAKKKQVSGEKKDLKVSFTIGSKTAYINGEKKSLQAAPFTVNGVTYVPLRVVAESTGSLVVYLQDVDIVLVNSPSFEGFVYDSPSGSLSITTDGELYVDNLLVLNDFLNFLQEEEIIFEKDISNGEYDSTFEKLSPEDFLTIPYE